MIDPTAQSRFWNKVDKSPGHGPNGQCWVWCAAINPDGYGRFYLSGRMRQSHRAAWLLCTGVEPGALKVLHSCDNPACVNPSHLRLGSQAENVADMVLKGRGWMRDYTHKGVMPGSKLSIEQVSEIIAQKGLGLKSQREIAEQYGVAQQTISKIMSGKRWKPLHKKMERNP